jgi:hypothetical protein
MRITISSLVVLSALLLLAPARADEDADDWVRSLKGSSPEPVSTTAPAPAESAASDADEDRALNEYGNLSRSNPQSLRTHAAAHLKNSRIDTAIKLAEESLEIEPDNTDGRQIYADALERKLKKQDPMDPHTFNMCVKQWYYLYKNAEYSEISKTAAQHLKALTGRPPAVYTNAKMYLSKVLVPELGNSMPTTVAAEEPQQIH